ncbi:MAG: PH domain-containing protein [Candidatus Subteraquimicrobiales bacterium]|nr:PH domain-containing protein [Candidatus Subteraquimicrobiales bacterium]
MPQENLPKYVPGEEVIFEIRPSVFILIAEVLGLVIAIGGIMILFYFSGMANTIFYLVTSAVGILTAAVMFLYWRSTVYILTSKRVENRVGIFGSREEEISLDDIQAVDVQQSILGTIFGFGTVMIKAAGALREVDFTNVASPKRVADRVGDLAIEASRGKHLVEKPQ